VGTCWPRTNGVIPAAAIRTTARTPRRTRRRGGSSAWRNLTVRCGNLATPPRYVLLVTARLGRMKSFRWMQQHSVHFASLGPVLYVTSIQYFVSQLFVALRWRPPYSLSRNTISDLGNTACGTWDGRYVCSPLHSLMNASFVVLGITMTLGSVLICRYLATSRSAAAGFAAMSISGAGVIMVGLFPENSVATLHELGAAIPFVLGNASLIILAAFLEIPAVLRVYSLLSGVLALLGLAAYTSSHYLGLGEGGMERVVAYPQTVFLVVIGFYLAAHSRRDGDRRLAGHRTVPGLFCSFSQLPPEEAP
jgi:hypothetical membrane protein